MASNRAGVTGPRVLFVYFTYTQQSLNAVKKSVAQIDGVSAKELKAGLAEAQAGMGG